MHLYRAHAVRRRRDDCLSLHSLLKLPYLSNLSFEVWNKGGDRPRTVFAVKDPADEDPADDDSVGDDNSPHTTTSLLITIYWYGPTFGIPVHSCNCSSHLTGPWRMALVNGTTCFILVFCALRKLSRLPFSFASLFRRVTFCVSRCCIM